MEYLQLGQYALASLELFGVAHNHLNTFSEIVWSSVDPSILSCSASKGTPGYADLRALKVGTAQLIADAQYDTGSGIVPWKGKTDIEIIDREVAYSEIHIMHGEVVPLTKKTPK